MLVRANKTILCDMKKWGNMIAKTFDLRALAKRHKTASRREGESANSTTIRTKAVDNGRPSAVWLGHMPIEAR